MQLFCDSQQSMFRSPFNPWLALIAVSFSLLLQSSAYATVIHSPKPIRRDPWIAESLYVGSGIFVADSATEITIEYRDVSVVGRNPLCELYLLNPLRNDSAEFLFHNCPEKYPTDPLVVNIGKYPLGTRLTFMAIHIDTSSWLSHLKGMHFYSGQNRKGVDQWISEICPQGTITYGCRHVLAGRIDSNTVEMGFDITVNFVFRDLVIDIKGVVHLEAVEKSKLPSPQIKNARSSSNSVEVQLFCPAVPDSIIVLRDTTEVPLDRNRVKVYYTTDGSDPLVSPTKLVYESSITIATPGTIKAYAKIEGDATWLRSEVVSETFQAGVGVLSNPLRTVSSFKRSGSAQVFHYYDIRGRFLSPVVHGTRAGHVSGCYLLRRQGVARLRREVMTGQR